MATRLPRGVMLNVYPDSIGERLSDTVQTLRRTEFADTFSLLYALPTFFNSDLDRGFSVIDYGLNDDLVSADDLAALDELGVLLKLDLVLNHLSVASPQFADLVANGDASAYRDFFIDWNEFWDGHGEVGPDGWVIPAAEHLDRLFMRKPGLPILRIRFPDGSDRFYWNTFYQHVEYQELDGDTIAGLVADGAVPAGVADDVRTAINAAIAARPSGPIEIDGLGLPDGVDRDAVETVLERRRTFLGQMDVNAASEQVWEFYEDTLRTVAGYGASILRLDAFAYVDKQVGESNFFNRPGTWHHLERLDDIATELGLTLLPEIHSQYGSAIHEELAARGFAVYDFFFPGLVIDALERGDASSLLRWAREIIDRDLQTVNMLGCHDGIPVIDLRGGVTADGEERPGLLADEVIESTVEAVLGRGGRVKNLYGPDGSKVSYYQVNATFYSALGEDDQRFLLARALQLFMPGTPQVWYLDLFAGRNDVAAADAAGEGGHKEINRTNLSLDDVDERLSWPVVRDQLELIRLRNTSPAFEGSVEITSDGPQQLTFRWTNGDATVSLDADLATVSFEVTADGHTVFSSP